MCIRDSAIDYTGDMPVILGPDGPSLGGFVSPASIALADQWKVGQLRPGNTLRFHAISAEQARRMLLQQDESIRTLSGVGGLARRTRRAPALQAVLLQVPVTGSRPRVCYRQSGEDNLLIEYGAPTLDLALRFRVQALLDALSACLLYTSRCV